MAASKRLRYEVLRRDAHTCRYCGAKAPDVLLTVDHVIPDALGGTDDASNLVTACRDCNSGKSSTSPDAALVEGVADDALRWAAAMRKAYDLIRAEREQVDKMVELFDQFWLTWWCGDDRDAKVPRPGDWRESIRRFLALGLGVDTLVDNAEFALANNSVKAASTWRYFCGVSWRKLEEQQELARKLIDDEAV